MGFSQEAKKARKHYVKEVSYQYRKAKKDIDLYKDGDIPYAKYIKQRALVNNVDRVLTLLSSESRDVIVNDFFGPKQKTYWWVGLYSKSTYYRRLSLATKEFIYYYKI